MSDDSVRDLVKRLRYHVCTGSEPPDCGDDACEAIHEAAGIIETQAARIIRLQSDLDRAEGFREGVRSGEAVDGWQPIETAPKDGRRFIAWGPQLAVAECEWRAAWGDHEAGWYRSNQHPRVAPAHWMPLPEPPVLHPEEDQ